MSQTEAADLLKQGIALARGGDKAGARPLLLQAVEQDPTSETAWMWLAGLAETPQEALSALERVLTINPANERARTAAHAARLQAGVAAAKAHKKARARALLRAVVAADPENEMAWMWLANVADSPADAASCLEKVLTLNPANDHARSTLERFRAAAPRPRPAHAAEPASPSTSLALAAESAARAVERKTILVVDDDPSVRELIGQAVGGCGYQIRNAADGYEAVDLLRDRGAPDLVLLAAALPGGMDGHQLCKLLRENRSTARAPIILLTNVDSLVGKLRGRLAGATAELVKPFRPQDLLRVVQQHCPPETAG